MEFDPQLISIPFRMQPGLRLLQGHDRHLHRLSPESPLYAERRTHDRLPLILPGFEDLPIRTALFQRARLDGICSPPPNALDFWPQLSLETEQDFAVLDARSGSVVLLQVCNPSRWAPEEKLGQSFTDIHDRIPGNSPLIRAAQGIVRLITDGRHWERHVWTLTPNPNYNQHPKAIVNPIHDWPDCASLREWPSQIYLRVERQTFLPVVADDGAIHACIFTIRVMREVLAKWLVDNERRLRLQTSLATMPEAILEYKGLAPVIHNLIHMLDQPI